MQFDMTFHSNILDFYKAYFKRCALLPDASLVRVQNSRASPGVSLRVYCISRVFRYTIIDFYLCVAIWQQFFLSVLAFCVRGRALCPAETPKGSGWRTHLKRSDELLTALWEGMIKDWEAVVTLLLSLPVSKTLRRTGKLELGLHSV